MDKAHKATDNALARMERRLNAIYSRAMEELGESWKSYLKQSGKELEELQKEYNKAKESGNPEDKRKAGIKLQKAKKRQTVQNARFKALTDDAAGQLTRVNQTAAAYVNGELPPVYALNYNAFAEIVDGDLAGYSFALTDAHTVAALAKEDPDLLPFRRLNARKDKAWNVTKINSEVLQGILQGEPMDKIAARLQKVGIENRNSAIRNARTCVTGAENKGREDSFVAAEKAGLILEKQWISSNQPGRTRDAHMPGAFDKIAVKIGESYHNTIGYIRYPGDPTAEPANFWQ